MTESDETIDADDSRGGVGLRIAWGFMALWSLAALAFESRADIESSLGGEWQRDVASYGAFTSGEHRITRGRAFVELADDSVPRDGHLIVVLSTDERFDRFKREMAIEIGTRILPRQMTWLTQLPDPPPAATDDLKGKVFLLYSVDNTAPDDAYDLVSLGQWRGLVLKGLAP